MAVKKPSNPKVNPPPASQPAAQKPPVSKPLTAIKKATLATPPPAAKSNVVQKPVQVAASHTPVATGKPTPVKTGAAPASALHLLMAGNPLAKDIYLAHTHEGLPSHLPPEKILSRSPYFGWNEEYTAGGYEILTAMRTVRGQEEIDVRADIVRDILSSSWMVAISATDWAYRYAHAEEIGRNPEDFQRLLEDAFGYTIEINTDSDQLQQLQRLAESNLAIVKYFNKLGLPGSVIFQKYFAQNDGSDVIVQVGFDDVRTSEGEIGPFQGYTPYADGDNTISLGSQTSVATITHEFFHQLDRHFNPIISSTDDTGIAYYLNKVAINSLLPNEGLPFQREGIILGGASNSPLSGEKFADFGMTAVLDGLGYVVVNPDNVSATVGFNPNSRNAQEVKCALRQYFEQILSGNATNLTFDPTQCF